MGWALALIAVAAWVLRFEPLTRGAAAFGYPIDYDEGVYFSASALFFQGHWPYRDFVFVHPPGGVWLWGPAALTGSWLGVDTGFTVARWLATLCGAASVVLAGRLALRAWGPVAGLVAALVYASYPEAVQVERGPFLEPWLNLACLAAANVWLEPPREGRAWRRWLVAGALFGVAISVKVLGGIWLFAALLSRSPRPSWRAHVGLVLAAGATVALLVGPFVLNAPSEFFSQVFVFQSLRPGDGELDRLARLREILHERRLVGVVLALLGLGVAGARMLRASRPSQPVERLLAVAFVLTVAAFLSSRSYWNQYNAYLAASEAVLAGLGAVTVHAWIVAHRPAVARYAAVLLGVAVLVPTLRTLLHAFRMRTPEQAALGRYIRQSVPPEAPLFAFEPSWGLAGGRLPSVVPGAPLVVDSYALMLQGGMASGQRLANATEAFQTPGSQQALRELLSRSRFVVLGWRGDWQLSEDTKQWFHSRFVRRFPPEGEGGIDLWEQAPP